MLGMSVETTVAEGVPSRAGVVRVEGPSGLPGSITADDVAIIDRS